MRVIYDKSELNSPPKNPFYNFIRNVFFVVLACVAFGGLICISALLFGDEAGSAIIIITFFGFIAWKFGLSNIISFFEWLIKWAAFLAVGCFVLWGLVGVASLPVGVLLTIIIVLLIAPFD